MVGHFESKPVWIGGSWSAGFFISNDLLRQTSRNRHILLPCRANGFWLLICLFTFRQSIYLGVYMIKKITIELSDKEIELTHEEAKQLLSDLKELFPDPIPFYQSPTYTTPIVTPYVGPSSPNPDLYPTSTPITFGTCSDVKTTGELRQ